MILFIEYISGYYCPAATTASNQFPCSAGVYGGSTGLTSAACSGPCAAGINLSRANLIHFDFLLLYLYSCIMHSVSKVTTAQ